MRYCRFEQCEAYELAQGRILIGPSDKEYSLGYLELNHKQKLSKHHRPAPEELIQISGKSRITIYKSHSITKYDLNPGDYIKIPANRKHVHENPTSEKSITLWKFEGDIKNIIEKITNK
ncbi:MAG: hypothetical protein MAG795_00883 [Candidatus Woesearchaeota archaeon]|nr:hypothetical protein [Candidatus Woesearchaeota archaeon]